MEPGDILLVEGNQRVSSAIKYLTQSTWSHAAFYLGKNNKFTDGMGGGSILIESDLKNGVTTIPLSNYESFNTRICRPIGLPADEKEKVINFMIKSIGLVIRKIKEVTDEATAKWCASRVKVPPEPP